VDLLYHNSRTYGSGRGSGAGSGRREHRLISLAKAREYAGGALSGRVLGAGVPPYPYVSFDEFAQLLAEDVSAAPYGAALQQPLTSLLLLVDALVIEYRAPVFRAGRL
jgi:hypothetical protein